MTELAYLAGFIVVIWLLYKMGVFLALSYFTDSAVIAADDFASKVAKNSAENAVKYQIDPALFKKSMAAKARNRAYRQSMTEQTSFIEQED